MKRQLIWKVIHNLLAPLAVLYDVLVAVLNITHFVQNPVQKMLAVWHWNGWTLGGAWAYPVDLQLLSANSQ